MTTFNEALAQTKPQLDAATAAAVAALAAADAAHEAYQQFTKAHPAATAATATAAESQTARQLHLAAENASIALAAADVHQDAMTSTYNAILSSVSAGKGNDPVPLAAEATLSPPVTPLITAPSPPASIPASSNPSQASPTTIPVVTSPAPPAEVAPASNPALVTPTGYESVTNPVPPVVPDNEFGAPGALDNVIASNAAIADDQALATQIAENAKAQLILDEQQTISQDTLTNAAPEPIIPTEDPAVLLQEQIDSEVVAFKPSGDSQLYNATQGADVPTSFNRAVDSQLYNATQGADVPTTFNAAKDSQAYNATQGITAAEAATAGAATAQDNSKSPGDWRVRLSLAPGANYLYKSVSPPGILLPLRETDGVIFPYTPNIQVSYAAHYDPAELTHSNYKIFQYKNSSVDNITITCEFTAQDTAEANYLLAVIHFFKSVTKMFYGQDGNPFRGTPPPLCYLTGLGQFQFDQHPLAITGFNYTLPTDVDYIRSSSTGTTVAGGATPSGGTDPYPDAQSRRMAAAAVNVAAAPSPPSFNFTAATNTQSTYVPTKMQISITAIPIVSRADISKEFSLTKYATGALLQGSKRPGGGGGIW